MLCKPKKEPVYQVCRWQKDGDHPSVFFDQAVLKYKIRAKDGLRIVRPGDWILREKAGVFVTYSDYDFNRHYEIIDE